MVKQKPQPQSTQGTRVQKLKDNRSYLAAGNFKNVVKKVCDATTVRLRKEVKQAAGGEKASKKASKSAAAAEVTATELEEVERRVKEVDCARAHLMTLEPFYAAPLGARLIECAIPPANQDGTIDTAALEAMVTAESSKEICAKLLEVIRKQEIVKLLTEGKGSVKYASPFLVKPSPETNEAETNEAEATAAAKPADTVGNDVESDSESSSDKDETPPAFDDGNEVDADDEPDAADSKTQRKTSRKRMQPTRLSDKMPPPISKAAKKEKKEGKKRTYVRSGLYSRDALVQANARMRMSGVDSDSSASPGVFTPTTGMHMPLPSPSDLNLISRVYLLQVCPTPGIKPRTLKSRISRQPSQT